MPHSEHLVDGREGLIPAVKDVGVTEPQHAIARPDEPVRPDAVLGGIVPFVAVELYHQPAIDHEVDAIRADLHLLHDGEPAVCKPQLGDGFQPGLRSKSEPGPQRVQSPRESEKQAGNVVPRKHPLVYRALDAGSQLLFALRAGEANQSIRYRDPPERIGWAGFLARDPMPNDPAVDEFGRGELCDGHDRVLNGSMCIRRYLNVNLAIRARPDVV